MNNGEANKGANGAAAPTLGPVFPKAQNGNTHKGAPSQMPIAKEELVNTDYGSLLVAVQGDRSKHPIVTLHDIGLNYVTNFKPFFGFSGMKFLFKNFCVYHITAPGQEDDAGPLPDTYQYRTMDQLAEQVGSVLKHFGLQRVIGFGVGAGANLLVRFSQAHPEKVEALIMINPVSSEASDKEVVLQKVIVETLLRKNEDKKSPSSSGIIDTMLKCVGKQGDKKGDSPKNGKAAAAEEEKMPNEMLSYLVWHHFGDLHRDNESLASVYRRYFQRINPHNLALFIESFMKRTNLGLDKVELPVKQEPGTLHMPTLLVVGLESPFLQDTEDLHSHLNPVEAQLHKLENCGMVMEEQPAKLTEVLQLFLQAQGHFTSETSPQEKIPLHGLRDYSLDGGVGGVDALKANTPEKPKGDEKK